MGGRKEAIAISALNRRNSIHFMATLAIINAIINAGNGIAAALSGGSGSSGGGDTLKKSIDTLRDLLLPEDATKIEERARRIQDKLQAAADEGPISVRAASSSSADKGRIRRGPRSDINERRKPVRTES